MTFCPSTLDSMSSYHQRPTVADPQWPVCVLPCGTYWLSHISIYIFLLIVLTTTCMVVNSSWNPANDPLLKPGGSNFGAYGCWSFCRGNAFPRGYLGISCDQTINRQLPWFSCHWDWFKDGSNKNGCCPERCNLCLGGGFKYFVFSPLPGEMTQFD